MMKIGFKSQLTNLNPDDDDEEYRTTDPALFLDKMAIVANKRDLTKATDAEIEEKVKGLLFEDEELKHLDLEKSRYITILDAISLTDFILGTKIQTNKAHSK